MFTLQISFKTLLLGGGGAGGVKTLVEVTVDSKEKNPITLRPRIRPQDM
jgi:hypothetical protein